MNPWISRIRICSKLFLIQRRRRHFRSMPDEQDKREVSTGVMYMQLYPNLAHTAWQLHVHSSALTFNSNLQSWTGFSFPFANSTSPTESSLQMLDSWPGLISQHPIRQSTARLPNDWKQLPDKRIPITGSNQTLVMWYHHVTNSRQIHDISASHCAQHKSKNNATITLLQSIRVPQKRSTVCHLWCTFRLLTNWGPLLSRISSGNGLGMFCALYEPYRWQNWLKHHLLDRDLGCATVGQMLLLKKSFPFPRQTMKTGRMAEDIPEQKLWVGQKHLFVCLKKDRQKTGAITESNAQREIISFSASFAPSKVPVKETSISTWEAPSNDLSVNPFSSLWGAQTNRPTRVKLGCCKKRDSALISEVFCAQNLLCIVLLHFLYLCSVSAGQTLHQALPIPWKSPGNNCFELCGQNVPFNSQKIEIFPTTAIRWRYAPRGNKSDG